MTDRISGRQALCLTALFILGASVVNGGGGIAGQDAWISLSAAALSAVPLIAVYARISALYPGENLFDIIFKALGKIAGWAVSLVFFLYALLLAALTLRSFTEFVQVASLKNTPQILVALLMGLLCAFALGRGIPALGLSGVIMFTFVALSVVLSFILLTGNMDFSALTPVMGQEPRVIARGALTLLVSPFAETVLMLTVLGALKPAAGRFKVLLWGLFLGFFLLLTSLMKALLTLGGPTFSQINFPSYIAESTINLGEFFQRVEAVIASTVTLCVFVKLGVCLYAACQGGAKLFRLADGKKIVYPITLLTVILSVLIFKNTAQMNDWPNVYMYFALPVQVILPVVIWIVAEIRRRKEPSV
ncbi:hypothetical protein FACS1894171_2070 [Clostridia bacterium]|nr:hypothetical protein FACS1894171_2070 [Clostridia bacterium]